VPLQGRALRAARLATRARARYGAGKLALTAESGRDAPAGNPLHHAAAARLTAKAHGGGRRGTNPGQLAAPAGHRTRRVCANAAILPAWALLKPSKITVKAVRDRSPTSDCQGDQVHVHAKTALTVIFHRFDSAPVGRMARTGLGPLQVQQEIAATAPRDGCRTKGS
jgi:hypothetical protein